MSSEKRFAQYEGKPSEKIHEVLIEDGRAVAGLLYVSDGSRGSEKILESLKQRKAYKETLTHIFELADEMQRVWPDATLEQFLERMRKQTLAKLKEKQ